MSFKSFLSAVGHDFENGLNLVLGDVSKIATAEAPILAKINPQAGAVASQIASLSTQAYGIVVQTEQKFAAMGKASSGPAKFNEAVAILLPAAAQILGLGGVELTTATNGLIQSAVDALDALPAALAAKAPVVPAVSSAPVTGTPAA